MRVNIKKQLKLAEKLLSEGKLLAARDAYFTACQQAPNDDKIWAKLGSIAKQLNHPRDAVFAFGKAIAVNSNIAAYYLELAQAQASLQNYTDAERNFQTHILMQPDSTAGCHAIAFFYRRLGRLNDAEKYYRQAISLNNADPQLHIELGGLLQQLGRFQEALTAYETARQLDPDNPLIYDCIGSIHRDQCLYEQAFIAFKRALALSPAHEASYHFNMGITYQERGQPQQALNHLEKALSIDPNHAHAKLSRAHLLLALGRYKEGWVEFESRLQHPEWLQQYGNLQLSAPRWDGKPLPDGTLLVIAEQGFGDTLQFCRYLPLLAQRCHKLIVYCKPELVRLLRNVDGISEIISTRDVLDDRRIDACVYMMSLPHYLAPEPVHWNGTYLTSDTVLREQWQQRISDAGFKIGLVWAGSPSHQKNAVRSLSLPAFNPLATVAGVSFYSLQKGPRAEQLATPPKGLSITDLGAQITDFADAAAAISCLDLVICADTATAHLAGGLGKAVWVLLYFPPDWRWQLEGESSVWYPSMRLFRQDTTRDWSPVIENVTAELRKLSAKQ
ncbi:MAG: glycosyltransferase family protein [Gammaproteobacteria bacterium]|nr:glycosyltransferase family protein [Gammaproteobacteria bacterium]